MKVCIYPGSFDPITFGHIDIIASLQFFLAQKFFLQPRL